MRKTPERSAGSFGIFQFYMKKSLILIILISMACVLFAVFIDALILFLPSANSPKNYYKENPHTLIDQIILRSLFATILNIGLFMGAYFFTKRFIHIFDHKFNLIALFSLLFSLSMISILLLSLWIIKGFLE